MIAIDTNVLLRWLVDEELWPDGDARQVDAVRTLFRRGEIIHVNSVTLSEMMWVLSKPMAQPASVIHDVIDRLLTAANVEVEHRDAVANASRTHGRRKVGLNDRLIAEINLAVGCSTTMTFDREAAKSAGFDLLEA